MQDGDDRHIAAFPKLRVIYPVGRQHVDDLDPAQGADVEQTDDEQAQGKEAQGKERRIREQHKGEPKRQVILGQQQGRDQLGAEHAKQDAGAGADTAQQEGLREEEPADGMLFHAEYGLHGELLLSAAEHVVVHVADQKQDEQRDGKDGQFHAVAQHGEIVFRSRLGMIVTACNG